MPIKFTKKKKKKNFVEKNGTAESQSDLISPCWPSRGTRDGLFCEYAQHKGVRGDVDMAEVLPRFVITHLDPSLTAATYDVYAIITSPWTKSFVFPFIYVTLH